MKHTIQNLEKSVVLRPQNFLPIKRNQILSLTFCRREKESAAFFSFDSGEGISKESADQDTLYVVLSGGAQIEIESDAHIVCAGQGIAVPAGVPHGVHATQPVQLMKIAVGEI
ncbi:cupin domain-containing protein [Clostridium minihomine]|uniref:cupin domain-containing protein n=1 Tax=Clostridium minihomine TaxID=2045012 RepID=UPI000C78AA5C|nr:cupin domain-containing protein [Clostridium minihomine]